MSKPTKNLHSRRRALALLGSTFVAPNLLASTARPSSLITHHSSPIPQFAEVVPTYAMRFPDDEGSHPDFRVEWWYVTGSLDGAAARPVGFQVTFFRVRSAHETANPSTFTPRQILIAHAAVSDPDHGQLIYEHRAGRTGFQLAEALQGRTAVWIDEWAIEQHARDYRIRLPARNFGFDFTLTGTQAPMLNGNGGYSRKGPARASASYYYSMPQLAVSGALIRDGSARQVTGKAWLDHEWSSSYLEERASGWDWIGINFDDGSALMAFRIRDRQQNFFWGGATYRDAEGRSRAYAPDALHFTGTRYWQSPRTGTRYPIAWTITVGDLMLSIEPYMEDQEQDASATTGAVYWEGAVRALAAGKRVGAGYLELTGYGKRLRL